MKRGMGVGGWGLALILLLLCQGAAAQLLPQKVLGQRDTTKFAPNYIEGREFLFPCCVAMDRSLTPNRLYVADPSNHRVLAWRDASAFTNGQVADLVIGQPDFFTAYSAGGDTGLDSPQGLAVDAAGNLYVADTGNHRVLLFPKPFDQASRPLKASAVLGQADFSGIQAGLAANRLFAPSGVAVDGSGTLAVVDTGNNRVLIFTDTRTGANAAKVLGQPSFTAGQQNTGAPEGRLVLPLSVAFNQAGNIFVGDGGNSRVLMFAPAAQLPVAGAAAIRVLGQANFTDRCAPASLACIVTPSQYSGYLGMATSGDDLLVADQFTNRVLVWRNASTVPASNAVADFSFGTRVPDGGTPDNSTMAGPTGVAVDSSGGVYVVDSGASRVLAYNAASAGARASRLLGQGSFAPSAGNRTDNIGMDSPSGIALDRSAQPPHLFVADIANNRVLGWRDAQNLSNGQPADLVLNQNDFFSSGRSTLNLPLDVAVDAGGQLYVAYGDPGTVAVYNRPFETGERTPRQIAMPGVEPSHKIPVALALDPAGNLFVALPGSHRVLQFAPGTTVPSRVFGQPDFNSFSANRSTATPSASSLNFPLAVATDAAGNLFIADTLNNRVLEFHNVNSLPLDAGAAARVYGQADFAGRIPAAGPTGMQTPAGVHMDPSGHLWVADTGNNRVLQFLRAVTPPQAGARASRLVGQPDLSTVEGTNSPQTLFIAIPDVEAGNVGRTGLATTAQALFVSDRNNHRVLQYALQVPATVSVVSGNNQTGPTGKPLAAPLVARVTDASNSAVPGVAVYFVADPSQGTVSASPAITDANGQASVRFTPASQGQLSVRAEVPGLSSTAVFNVTVSGSAPVVSQGGVVNGASFRPDQPDNPSPVSAGAIVSIFGRDFLPPDASPVFAASVPLPKSLGGVSVTFNGTQAPLFYVSGMQINAQVPFEVTGTSADVRVSLGTAQSEPARVGLALVSPGVFTKDSSGKGAAAVLNEDGSVNAPENPEARGKVIQIFATGQGPVQPTVQTGAAAPALPPAQTPNLPNVLMSGRVAEVTFSGLAPGFVGLWQINARIPADAPTGSAVVLEVRIEGRSANVTRIAVK